MSKRLVLVGRIGPAFGGTFIAAQSLVKPEPVYVVSSGRYDVQTTFECLTHYSLAGTGIFMRLGRGK